ncbi:cyclic nucleotide-binding domain-containing protein [Pseudolabrys sp. FHR47]|uniref:cyclic nucleotide-binding domain-containing protein n=1 Tax=Pseudolabrys sp. FHR47 TaxID=2562284 RepID=UPI0010BE64E6|nr:Crp/Fnr family transcriptional regulator [Pseudolabrys sp. FHR47]
MSLDDDIVFFRQVPLFAALDKEAVRILAIGAETRSFQMGSVLFYAGDLADGGYIVLEGTLSLESGTYAEGKDRVVGPGTLIGELAMLTDMVWHFTAVAREPVTVVRITRNLFRKMLEGYPAAAVALRDLFAKRLDGWQGELNAVKKMMEKGSG